MRLLIVNSGTSFDSLAKIYSDDTGSASSGGRLGFTERGTLVQAYEEAAYALLPGEIGLPIRSKFGYHLIRLIDKRGEKISSQHILVPVSFSNIDKEATYFRQTCVMAFRGDFLQQFCKMPQSNLELVEGIDMLRLIQNDYPIASGIIDDATYPVDVPEDIKKIEAVLSKDKWFKKYIDNIDKHCES